MVTRFLLETLQMDIVVDGYKDLVSAEEGSTVGIIVDQLRKWLNENGRAVLRIEIDDKLMDEAALEAVRNDSVEKFRLMNVSTISVSELAVSTLSQVLAQCSNLSSGFCAVAERIQKGSLTAGHKTLRDCAEAMQLILGSLRDVGHLTQVDYKTLSVEGESVADVLDKIRKDLDELRAAIDRKDITTIADLAKHELSVGVTKISNILKLLIDEIVKKAEAAEEKRDGGESSPAASPE